MKKLFALIAVALLLTLSACSSDEQTRYDVTQITTSRNETFYVVFDKQTEQRRFVIVSDYYETMEEAQAVCDSIEADWKKNKPQVIEK